MVLFFLLLSVASIHNTVLGNGTVTSHTYDAAGWLRKVVDATSTGTTITAYQYTYDNVGNKLGRINADEELTVWTYDAINQLKTETLAPDMSWNTFSVNDWNNFTADDWNNFEASNSSGETTTFTYDPVGNRLLKETESEVTTSTYDVANQHLTSEDSTGVTTFTYDQNGNQTSLETPTGDITTNTWTYENQLRSVENPANELTTYTYTPVNRSSDEYQVQKETETETTKTLWDNNNILQEYDTTTEAQYNYAPQTYGDLISQHRDTESSYYHYDDNYSTSALTDSTQSETDTYNYTAWGEATSNSGTTENPFTWKGEVGYVFDEQTGLFTLRRRQYRPESGRFISEDPIGIAAGDTNFFAYVGNDPVNGVDPSGDLPEGTWIITIPNRPTNFDDASTGPPKIITKHPSTSLSVIRAIVKNNPGAKVRRAGPTGTEHFDIPEEFNPTTPQVGPPAPAYSNPKNIDDLIKYLCRYGHRFPRCKSTEWGSCTCKDIKEMFKKIRIEAKKTVPLPG